MEGIAKTRVWGFPVASKIYTKIPSKMHHIFDDFWEPAGTHSAIQNHSKMHPESHRKFIDFWIDFCINFGIILGGKMLPKSHPKIDENLIDFWMNFWSKNASKMNQKWHPRRPKMPTSCRQNADTDAGWPKGAKREPNSFQNGAQIEPKFDQTWSQNVTKMWSSQVKKSLIF